MERPDFDEDSARPPEPVPGRDPKPVPPDNPKVTPMDPDKNVEDGIEVNET